MLFDLFMAFVNNDSSSVNIEINFQNSPVFFIRVQLVLRYYGIFHVSLKWDLLIKMSK